MTEPPPLLPIPPGQASTAPRQAEERNGLTYLLGRWVPGPGQAEEVVPGIFWVRMACRSASITSTCG